MSILNFLALANPQGSAGGSGGGLMTMLMFGSVFAIFWFMILRPQKKQADQRKAMIEALKRGDKIVTSGGLFATVRDVKPDRIVATIGENVKVEIAKHAISGVVESEEA
jgi:preprotein translocase subunit YajC